MGASVINRVKSAVHIENSNSLVLNFHHLAFARRNVGCLFNADELRHGFPYLLILGVYHNLVWKVVVGEALFPCHPYLDGEAEELFLDGFCQNDSMKPMMNDRLAQQLKQNEGKWVALFGAGEEMVVVASGEDAVEAIEQAKKRGYADTTLMKVIPTDAAYVPLT